MTYLLQVTTKDFEMQLSTEVTADTIEQLQLLASKMVKKNPAVIGMKYIIAKYTKVGTKLLSETLKTGIIKG